MLQILLGNALWESLMIPFAWNQGTFLTLPHIMDSMHKFTV